MRAGTRLELDRPGGLPDLETRMDDVRAVMDAAGFRITGTDAKLGRTFTEEDERPGAPPVVVIGHDLWRNMFGSDPAILGRFVKVGTEPATIL